MMRASVLLMVGCLMLALATVAVAQRTDYMPEERHDPKPMDEPDHLRQAEAKLVDELEEIHRKMEHVEPDSPNVRELEKHTHTLMQRLEDIRKEMRHQPPEPQHLNPERHELERALEEHMHELERLRRDHAGDPKIHGLEVRIEEIRHELEDRRGPKPMHPPEWPPMNHMLKIFHLEHAPAEHIAEIVDYFGGPGSVTVPDSRTNTVIVRAEPHFLDQIHEIIEHIDAPPSPIWQRLAGEEVERELHMLGMQAELRQHMERLEHDEGEWEDDHEDRAHEREERPTLHLTIRPGEEGLEFFLQEERISMEGLHERLSHLDVPAEWLLFVHVTGEVEEETVHHIAQTAEEMGFREIRIEHRKHREMERHEEEMEHEGAEDMMEHDEAHESREGEMEHGEGHAEEAHGEH